MVRGCLEYRKIGLAEPEGVKAAIQAYRDSEDTLGRWLREECTVSTSAGNAPASGLYQIYRNWCQSTGEQVIRDRDFRAELIKRGVPWKKTEKCNVYVGIKAGIIEVR
jgi:putative DNA primase/helicase